MRYLSGQTDLPLTLGQMIETSKSQQRVMDAERSQHTLGYVSDVPVQVSEFRRIQVTTKQKRLIVQARDRYWARR
ncbi:MAG: hypothetical protein U0Q18_06825 [Bryobacteraceae bacterium]